MVIELNTHWVYVICDFSIANLQFDMFTLYFGEIWKPNNIVTLHVSKDRNVDIHIEGQTWSQTESKYESTCLYNCRHCPCS